MIVAPGTIVRPMGNFSLYAVPWYCWYENGGTQPLHHHRIETTGLALVIAIAMGSECQDVRYRGRTSLLLALSSGIVGWTLESNNFTPCGVGA